jgi:hypothetical protein
MIQDSIGEDCFPLPLSYPQFRRNMTLSGTHCEPRDMIASPVKLSRSLYIQPIARSHFAIMTMQS